MSHLFQLQIDFLICKHRVMYQLYTFFIQNNITNVLFFPNM